MGRFRWKNKPTEEASSSSKKQASRLPWRRRKLGGSDEAAEPPSSSQVVDKAKLPSVSKTATTLAESAAPSEPYATNNKTTSKDGGAAATMSVEPAGPSESCATDNKTTPKDGGATATDPKSLWHLAYEALRKEKPGVVQAYEELLSKTSPYLASASPTADLDDLLSKASNDLANTPMPDTDAAEVVAQSVTSQQMMADIIDLGQKHMEGKQIAFKIGQQKFVLQDQMQHVVAGIQLGRDWIDDAVKASPLASAAWAGVCLFLPLLTNPSEVQAANEEGLAYVAQKIRYYTAMESLLLCGEDEEVFPTSVKREYQDRLIELYQAIIDFQAQSVLRLFRRRFSNFLRDTVKWDSWEAMLEKIKELGRHVENQSLQINTASSRAALGVLVQWARESEEDKCLQSLRRGDYAWYKDRVEVRVPDTCLWFLSHVSYQSWLEADSGPLLVSADPGCGKSVLARYLIDSRFDFRLPRDAAICYFFFKDQDQNTIELALCALVHQLLCLRPQLMRHALPRYKQDGPRLANNVTALWNILESATADPEAGAVLVVLDALDECLQDEHNMKTLSRFIHSHFEKRPRNMKILMTTRPYEGTIQHIQELGKTFPNIRIKGEDDSEAISEEINSVIEFRITRMEKFSNDLKAHLKKRLMNITHRTYLWLYLIFEYLKDTTVKSTVRGLDEAVALLPATVEEAYEKILSRSSKPNETRKAILILLAAHRPLTLREMQIAIDITPNTTCLGSLDLEPDEAFKLRLREWCGLFITVHDEKVYFLHQTAREFLLPLAASLPGPTTTAIWAHTFNIRQAHTVLAESCMVYLDLLNLPTDANAQADLLDYSAENWGTHFREAGITDGAAIVSLALRICNPDSKSYSAWSEIYQSVNWGFTNNFTDLTIASHFGHEAVAKLLLEKGADVDSKTKDGRTPLRIAAQSGHEAVVKLLLEKGADVDLKDKNGWTPLWVAAQSGHEAVVNLLLEKGADVDSKDKWGQTPLQMAAGSGHEAVVKLLFEKGADVDSKNKWGRTPLQMAAESGYEAVVKLLLEKGADVDLEDKDGWTPLWVAARGGHEAVVKLLLEKGADVDSKDKWGRTPLQMAAKSGHKAVVKLLKAME